MVTRGGGFPADGYTTVWRQIGRKIGLFKASFEEEENFLVKNLHGMGRVRAKKSFYKRMWSWTKGRKYACVALASCVNWKHVSPRFPSAFQARGNTQDAEKEVIRKLPLFLRPSPPQITYVCSCFNLSHKTKEIQCENFEQIEPIECKNR